MFLLLDDIVMIGIHFFVLRSDVHWSVSPDEDKWNKRTRAGRQFSDQFCVRPIAPPSPLTTALFCSCAWSIAMAEKGPVDLCTTKLPRSNSFATPGSRSCSVVISRICTGTQRE